MNKTFFENLGDLAEQGQIIEQKIRLCIATKAGYEELPFIGEKTRWKIAVQDRYERLLKRKLKYLRSSILKLVEK